MGKPEEIIRTYHLADDDMLELSNTFITQFEADKADFVDYDEDFDDPYQANWQADLTAAENVPKDEVVVDEQTGLSATVEDLMDQCRHKFQSSKFFIEKAFPDNKAVQNEFGYDDYGRARQAQARMIGFMKNFHRVALKYSEQLINVNYSQNDIDEIETLRAALHQANELQEAFKKGRPVLTQDRIITLNKPWDVVVLVHKAATNIYHDDPAKLGQYELPQSPPPGGEEPLPEPPPGG